MTTTSHRALQVGQQLFPLFALALDLPENFFDDKVFLFLLWSDVDDYHFEI